MGYNATAYQTQFREKLAAEFQEQFDKVIELANSSANLKAFTDALPNGFAPFLKGVSTMDGAIDEVLKNTEWGGVDYVPPKAVVAKKALAAKPAIKAPVTPGADATDVPAKRRGNPEALKKAREARNTKSPEENAADKATVINAMVAYLKANAGPQGIKPTIAALIEALKGKSVKATDLTESFIYSTVTATVKDDTCPFKFAELEGRKKGYALK